MSNGILTFLSSIGTRIESFFRKAAPVVLKADQVAGELEPFVDTMFPGVASLYNTVVAEVGAAETASIAAASQANTGPQKLAAVLASTSVQKAFTSLETTAGVPPHTLAQQAQFVSAVVATLNSLNAPSTTSSAA